MSDLGGLSGAALRRAAEAWLAVDPDPDTRAELEALLADPDESELAERFTGRLQFGTAGLRGQLGAGPNRMNRVLVRRAAAGLARWLQQSSAPQGSGVVICYDARHKSRDFAYDTASVMAEAGVSATLLPGPLPTPVLAFAVKHLRASAGVMVTASHNPRRDNGYKVYDHSGTQIVAPADAEISAEIDAVTELAPGPAQAAAIDHPLVTHMGEEVLEAYLGSVTRMLPDRPPAGRPLRIVYSSLHGVGGQTVLELLDRAGFRRPDLVAQQFDPDPEFPTVAFPNPEEPGAMDLTLDLCRKVEADIAFVNDPDADRLAVAVPDPNSVDGWRMLRGDEVGVLLADAVLNHPPVAGPETADLEPVLACSIVSSQQLGRMAAAAGVAFESTLTGFKWVARAPGPNRRLLFGYEEALGYCVGDLVGDKDGVSALLLMAQRASVLRAQGETLLSRLDDLSRAHGLHVTRQVSFRLEGAAGIARIAEAMAALRSDPPRAFAGCRVETVEDLSSPPPESDLPTSDVVIYRLDDARVIVRPSGTEPKLKCYLEVVLAVGDGPEGLAAAHAAGDHQLTDLAAAVTTVLDLA